MHASGILSEGRKARGGKLKEESSECAQHVKLRAVPAGCSAGVSSTPRTQCGAPAGSHMTHPCAAGGTEAALDSLQVLFTKWVEPD